VSCFDDQEGIGDVDQDLNAVSGTSGVVIVSEGKGMTLDTFKASDSLGASRYQGYSLHFKAVNSNVPK
jgi:hypothetical protein